MLRRLLTTALLLAGLCTTLPAQTNLQDLAGWPANKLPVSAEWATGHELPWATGHIRAGRRLLPTFVLYTFAESTSELTNGPTNPSPGAKKVTTKINPIAAEFTYCSDNQIGLVFRHQGNSAGDIVADQNNRGTYPGNTLAEWRLVGGVTDSKPVCDHLASPSLWATQGTLYGTSLPAARIKELTPGCPWYGYFDNHEAGHETGKVGSNSGPNNTRVWQTAAQLEGLSLSLKDKVTELGLTSDPYNYIPEIFLKQEAQYEALFGAFGVSMGKPVLSAAYSAGGLGGFTPQSVIDRVGPVGDALAFKAGGPSCYIYGSAPNLFDQINLDDITKYMAGWEWMEAHETGRFRIMFVSIGTEATEGPHGTTTPALFKAWCEWMAWQARAVNGGQPLLLEHWIGSSMTPTTPFGSTGYFHGDYSVAPALACDSICRPVIREYWLTGQNVVSTCSHAQVRIRAVKKADKYLVFSWSPYTIAEVDMPITVNGLPCTIKTPSASVRYWELSAPVPTSLNGSELN